MHTHVCEENTFPKQNETKLKYHGLRHGPCIFYKSITHDLCLKKLVVRKGMTKVCGVRIFTLKYFGRLSFH